MIEKRWVRPMLAACVACASLALLALPAGAAAKTKRKTATFSQCVNLAVTIPDGPPTGTTALNPVASVAIPVRVPKFKGKPQDGVVTSVNSVGVRITHSDDGDLALFLASPGGKAVSLSTYRDQSSNVDDQGDPSPSGDGYGTGAQSCSGSLVQFGDSFPTSIATPGNKGMDAPIAGSFSPEQPLGTFVGGPARGFWTLIVQDVQFEDVGQIDAFSVNVTYTYKAKKKKKKKRR
jgi:subtilisin-like proprotein convertase family protein